MKIFSLLLACASQRHNGLGQSLSRAVLPRLVAMGLGLALAGLSSPSAQAANVYWDTNGNGNGTTTGAVSGTWDAGTTALWTTSSAGTATTTTYATANGSSPSTADVFFSAGTNGTGVQTVTVSGGVTARTITVEEGSLVLAGTATPILTLGSGGLTIGTGAAAASSTAASLTSILLSASQTWQNNNATAANTFITNAATPISGVASTGAITFTLDGTHGASTTATNPDQLAGILSNGTGNTLSVVKSGAGAWYLSNANTYTGGTTLNAGELHVGNATALGTGGLTINGGTIIPRTAPITLGNAVTVGGNFSLAFSNGTVSYNNIITLSGNMDLGGVTRTITVADTTQTPDAVLSGVISNGGLTKAGTGTLTLSGANTYTGATTISAGTLSVATLANGGTNSNIGASTNAAANLVLNGGTLSYTGAAVSTDRLFSVGTGGGTIDASGTGAINFTNNGAIGFNAQTGTRTLTLAGTNTGSNTIAAVIGDNSGATSLTKTGAGTWTLSGANTYTGATTLSAGTLKAGVASVAGVSGAFGNNSDVTTADVAGGLDLNGFNTQIGSITGGGTTGGGLILGSATLTVAGSASPGAYAGVISGTGGSLIKSGTGTLYLNAANTYTGGTTLNTGELQLGSNTALGTGAVAINGGAISSRGGVRVPTNAITVGGDFTLSSVASGNATTLAGTVDLGGTRTINVGYTGAASAISGVISNGGLTKAGTGSTLNLSGVNTYAGDTTISAGTLGITGAGQLGSGTYAGNISNADTLQYSSSANQTLSGVISGAGTLTKDTGAGTLTLSGTNTYTGATTLTTGTVAVGNNAAFGTSTVNLSGAAIQSSDATARTIGNAITLSTSTTFGTASTGNLLFSGAVNVGNSNGIDKTFTINNTLTEFSGVLSGTGNGQRSKAGSGTLIFSGANTYTGPTTVSAGTLRLGAGGGATSGVLGTNAAGTSVTSGAVLDLNGQAVTSEALTINGTGISNGGALINSSGTAASFGGVVTLGSASSIGGSGNITLSSGLVSASALQLNKVGAGTLTLDAASSRTGTTAIDAGVLRVRNATAVSTSASSAITVNSILELNNGITLDQPIALNTGGTVRSDGSNTSNGKITVANGASVTLATVSSGDLFSIGNGANDVSGADSAATIRASGPGTIQLNNASDYAGSWTLNSGTVKLGNVTALGPVASANVLFGASSTGKLQLNGNDVTVIGLNTNATVGTPVVESGSATAGTNTLTVNNATANTYAGVLQNGSTRLLALVKGGAGTLTLSGTNTYTGTTTINAGTLVANNAGGVSIPGSVTVGDNSGTDTLQLGAASTGDQIANGAAMTLNRGTFDTNGQNETLGALTLTDATTSFIDLSGSASILKYQPASGSALLNSPGTGTAGLVQVLDWNGSTSGGGTDQLFFGNSTTFGTGATALSVAQLAQITFVNPNGTTGSFTAAQLNTGEVVPILGSKLVFTTTAQTLTAGVVSGTITVQLQDAQGNAANAPTGGFTVTLSTTSSGGVFRNTGDTADITSVTITAGTNSASFKYRDTKAGTPTITASATGLTPATQQETVNPAAASALAFVQQPTNTVAGATITPSVTVKIVDAFGNTVTSDGSTQVTLAIGTNPGSGTLSGTTTQTAVNGIATFNDLSINKSGTGYTLTSSATGLTGVTSNTFNITAGAATQLSVSAPANATAGTAFNITVTALDANNNVATNYGGTVNFTSTDGNAILPANTTLTNGTGTFSVTLNTSGNQTITATDTATSSITGTATVTVTAGSPSATSGAVISEFRLRGSNGSTNEYVELLNTTNADLNISNWKLNYVSNGNATSVTIPSNTILKARGHYLLVGAGYNLTDYAAAETNAPTLADIDDSSTLTLVNAVPGNMGVDVVNQMTPTANGEYAFVRSAEAANSNSFAFVSTNQGTYSSIVSLLGAPGPQNTSSPVQRNNQVVFTTPVGINNASAKYVVGPPKSANYNDAASALSSGGQLSLRRTLTNNTGDIATKLRFRLSSTSGAADLRAISSKAASVTAPPSVTLNGLRLEAPSLVSAQGGGLNSSWITYDLTTNPLIVVNPDGTAFGTSMTGLPAGKSANFEFLFAINNTAGGSYRVVIDAELLP